MAIVVAMAVRMHINDGGGEQTTHATGTCALSVRSLRSSFAKSCDGFFCFPAERADVLLGVLRKTLPKATVFG